MTEMRGNDSGCTLLAFGIRLKRLAIDVNYLWDDTFPTEFLHSLEAFARHCGAQGIVFPHSPHLARHRRHIEGIEHSHGLAADLRQRSCIGTDNGAAAGYGFQHRNPEPLE